MLTTLPTELLLQILSYLPLSTLSIIASLNKTYAHLISANSSVIYRNAACLSGFARTDMMLDEVLAQSEFRKRVGRGVEDWRDYCKRRTTINHAWLAHASSHIKFYNSFKSSNSVHRIKVDEKRGFVITTSQRGGLNVVDLESDEVVWSLPETYVRPFAHLEYESGYLIFDRTGGSKEIWRLSSLPPSPSVSPSSLPDTLQLQIAQSTTPNSNRIHFTPHAHITPPTSTRAYRFVYPDLLAASSEILYIYDIPSGALVTQINNIQAPLLGDLNYVDLSKRHVFVAAQRGISVFSRETGKNVLHLGSAKWEYGRRVGVENEEGAEKGYERTTASERARSSGGATVWPAEEEGEWYVEEEDGDDWEDYDEGWDTYVQPHAKARTQVVAGSSSSSTAQTQEPEKTWESRWGGTRVRDSMSVEHRVEFDKVPDGDEDSRGRRVVDEFIAVHVSRDGKHFTALLSNSRVVLVHNFVLALSHSSPLTPSSSKSSSSKLDTEQPAQTPVPIEDLSLDIQLGSRRSPSVYLAFEDDRVAVVSQSAIWIVHVPPPPLSPSPSSSTSYSDSVSYADKTAHPSPPIRITRIPGLNTPWHLARISCLQLSPSGLYVNWHNAPNYVLTDNEWESSSPPGPSAAQGSLAGLPGWEEVGVLGLETMEEKEEKEKWEMRRNEERFEREFWGRVGERGCFASTPSGDLIVLDDGIQVGVDFRQNTVVAVEFVP